MCNSNTIRVDKANEYVFSKISELLTNEKIDKELEKLDKKKKKIFELYEDESITKDDFLPRNE
ncbi:hypothetical protein [Clostridium botulinum]|uniref:hypothetical protein n=1 Tax=Clostridium botulinum TaxID=1491 RepID=UPI001FAF5D32|nr:hypothetical protein [Clostridium botulinum]